MERPLKIAMMVRACITIPRPKDLIYAPIDLALKVAEGLGEKGHQVTVFAPLGSELHANNVTLESLNLRPLIKSHADFKDMLKSTDKLAHDLYGLWDRYMVAEMYRRARRGEYDLLYFHHPEAALSSAVQNPSVQTVYTLNDPIYPWYRELFELFSSPNQQFISISENQRRDAPDLPYLDTVYNGVDISMFDFSDEPEDYLLFVGRIIPEKGVKEAIQVANETKHRLLIIGPTEFLHEDYFEQYIKPELNDKILYLAGLEQSQLPRYYQKAKALLTPVQWEEPFGMTTIEAMACGTPVISLHRGAAPEIIVDGKTGFVVNSIFEMSKAVEKIGRIKRRDCREHITRKFATKHMVNEYERVFYKVLGERGKKSPIIQTEKFFQKGIRKVKKSITSITKEQKRK